MEYMIPKNINHRFEFFPGWGWKELFICLLGLIAGFLLYLFLGLFVSTLAPKLIVAIICVVVAFFGSSRDPRTGKSMFDFLKDFNGFRRSQRQYYYRFGRGRSV